MATIGNTLTGGNTRNILSAAKAIYVPSFPVNATINSLTAKITDTSAATWQAGVWLASDGTVVASGQVRTDITTVGSYTFTFASESLVAGTGYYFGVCCDSAAGATVSYVGGAETYEGYQAAPETPNQISTATFAADTTRDYSIQIDYTESGGGSSIAPIASFYQRLRTA